MYVYMYTHMYITTCSFFSSILASLKVKRAVCQSQSVKIAAVNRPHVKIAAVKRIISTCENSRIILK